MVHIFTHDHLGQQSWSNSRINLRNPAN